jgi:Na+-transporting NADH:ubiquinone oxidoreductase subunit E
MENLLNIFISSIFIDNMIFAYFLGMCAFLAISKTVRTSVGFGLVILFVLVVTVPINYIIFTYVLQRGALAWLSPDLANVDLSFLSFVMFIAVIAAVTQLVEMVVEKHAPTLYNELGIFLPLVAVQCAIMGGSLFMQERDYANILEVSVFAFGSGVGWLIAIIGISAIREKIRYSDIPAPLRGLGIAFIVTGLMALGFMSFMGIRL